MDDILERLGLPDPWQHPGGGSTAELNRETCWAADPYRPSRACGRPPAGPSLLCADHIDLFRGDHDG